MADRETVVRDLQYLISFGGASQQSMVMQIATDALALLNEQETVEHACDILRANGWKETEPLCSECDAVHVAMCKDCTWWERKNESSYGYCNACKHGYHSSNWEIGIYRLYKEDFFCADGEQKDS